MPYKFINIRQKSKTPLQQEARADSDHFRAEAAVDKINASPAAHIAEHQPGEEGDDGGDRGGVNDGCEPAYVIGVLVAERDLSVVDDAGDFVILGGQFRENKRADDADDSAEEDGEQTGLEVAACFGENFTALDEYAGADHDADDHGNGGR